MEVRPQQEIFLSAYDTYADAIFRYCNYKTSDREVALDLTQSTFCKLWIYMQEGQEIVSVRPFLYQIAGNLVIDWYRKKKSDSLENLMEHGFDPPDMHNRSDAHTEYAWAMEQLKKLDTETQELIIWRYVEDMTPKEIAALLDEKENTVSMRVYRALKQLKKLLQEPHLAKNE